MARWNFLDVLKRPREWRREAGRTWRALERDSVAAQKWSDDEVAEAVRWFVFEASSSMEVPELVSVLKALGSRVHPFVLHLLAESSERARLTSPTGENLGPEAPFDRACALLDPPPDRAAPLLAPFLEDPAPSIRKTAAYQLGRIGTAEAAGPLRSALSDRDEDVRAWALTGLLWPLRNQGLESSIRDGLYAVVERLVATGENGEEACEVLLRLDEARATQCFLSPAVSAPGKPSLKHALRAMVKTHVALPRTWLLTLIEQLEQDTVTFRRTRDRSLGLALQLLGRLQVPEDRQRIEAYTSVTEPRIAAAAAAGLIASWGLEEPVLRARIVSRSDYPTLAREQRHYAAVMELDAEIRNGGLSQYFFNSGSDHWRDAQDGLAAMCSRERLDVFLGAIARFGPAGPAAERSPRQDQLARLMRESERPFAELDRRYSSSSEVVEVLALRYVIQHREAFR